MKKQIIINYQEFASQDQLPLEDQELMAKAIEVRKGAYAPYSEFLVGAAVRLENGRTVIGSNQENAAYPSGLCAERVALFSASAQYPDQKVEALAIYAEIETSLEAVVSPCGACRQVMSEYQWKQKQAFRVILGGKDGKIWLFDRVEDLLPFSFDASQLKM